MVVWSLLLVALAAADAPQVELNTLSGEQYSGALQSLGTTEVELKAGAESHSVPLRELLEIRFTAPADVPAPKEQGIEVTLADGSKLQTQSLTSTTRQLELKGGSLGDLQVPLQAVAHIRLGPAEEKLMAAWEALLEKEAKGDLLVIRKGNVLDFLDGVIGEIDATTVRFLLGKDEIPVKRERVYGLIFARKRNNPGRPICEAELAGGNRVQLTAISWSGNEWKATLSAGADVTIPANGVRALDFSLGKVRYLSQMEPREVKYVPYFDFVMKYQRDRSLDGPPIRLGDKTYSRGLAIHSQTLLRYRIGGEYRRFQAVMGIDESLFDKRQLGHVHVVIRGDGKVLLETDVSGKDSPRPVDLDVSGVRDLEILVDFGENLSICDHLDLADARVIK